jgi:hypothetical protein
MNHAEAELGTEVVAGKRHSQLYGEKRAVERMITLVVCV